MDGLRCQNEKALILATTSSPDVLISIINRFNCSDPTTYFFGDTSLGFSNATCYNLMDNLNDNNMSASAGKLPYNSLMHTTIDKHVCMQLCLPALIISMRLLHLKHLLQEDLMSILRKL